MNRLLHADYICSSRGSSLLFYTWSSLLLSSSPTIPNPNSTLGSDATSPPIIPNSTLGSDAASLQPLCSNLSSRLRWLASIPFLVPPLNPRPPKRVLNCSQLVRLPPELCSLDRIKETNQESQAFYRWS
jgi:hypothetical protein